MHLIGQIFEEDWWKAGKRIGQLHLNFEFRIVLVIKINQLLIFTYFSKGSFVSYRKKHFQSKAHCCVFIVIVCKQIGKQFTMNAQA
jgi:hypothetical protein